MSLRYINMGIIKPIAITFLSILILGFLLPSVSYLNFTTLIVASIVLTILQKFVRPVMSILFLPINLVTLGIFAWMINVLILWMAMFFVPGFHIDQVIVWGHKLGPFFSLIFVSFALGLIQSAIDFVF
jgi:putative membrane protein